MILLHFHLIVMPFPPSQVSGVTCVYCGFLYKVVIQVLRRDRLCSGTPATDKVFSLVSKVYLL